MSQRELYDLGDRLIMFASNTIDFIENQPQRIAVVLLSKQLIKSCTSGALNYGEACVAESKRDFVHKMNISLKELNETSVTLKILQKRPYVNQDQCSLLLSENIELIKIFMSSLKTARGKQMGNQH
jgi:four helix bundle protein